jgi:DNA-binding NarL/FixJ family response regulator
MALRILIADDNDRVRRGVIDLLSEMSGCEVCGEAKDGAEAIEKARALLPDLILLDISMPGISGINAAPLIRKEAPKAKILIMSQHDPAILSRSLEEVGADGYIDKSRLASDLLPAIKALEKDSV